MKFLFVSREYLSYKDRNNKQNEYHQKHHKTFIIRIAL